MTLRTALAAFALVLSGLSGCAAVGVAEYRAEAPTLDIARYFNGTIDGWGMFQDRSGKPIKRFYVRIDATWVGDQGTLDEHFEYADGTRQQRIWTVVKDGDRYLATAGDVVGTARGEAAGNALNWKYVLALPVDDTILNVDMDDWMFLVDERTLLNRTTMSKFGFKVGEVTLAFRKR
jgi:hypothetical protein